MDEYINAVISADLRANRTGETQYILPDLSITSTPSDDALEVVRPNSSLTIQSLFGESLLTH